jgi:hypothetical protein
VNRRPAGDVTSGVTRGVQFAARLLAVAALAVSSWVHFHVAHLYIYGSTITGTDIFRAQAAAAALVAVVLLLTGHRYAWIAAAAIGLASFAAVMTYRYVDVGAIGPIPDMYDPTWSPSPDKVASAVAEACIPLLWVVRTATVRWMPRRSAVRA